LRDLAGAEERMTDGMAEWKLERTTEGQNYSFEVTLSADDVDAFGAVTGDENPLHMSEAFARGRGFGGRVVHGALLGGLVSRLVGMHLPGRNALLHELHVKFRAPAYVGQRLLIGGTVVQRSETARAIVLRVEIADVADRHLVASAKAIVGFTDMGSA
jgi:3-hydroxybutyryl-CoA dehydratase